MKYCVRNFTSARYDTSIQVLNMLSLSFYKLSLMDFSFTGIFYKILIDPVLDRFHDSILINILSSNKVIDVACGTGSMALAIAENAMHVTGIDLSEEMIRTANRTARKRGISNVNFIVCDASNLSMYKDCEFDIAVTSMAVHQFESETAIVILSEMRRIACKVIILDYNFPLSTGISGSLINLIEMLAGSEHYRNFRRYMKNKGIRFFTDHSGIEIRSEVVRGNSNFVVVEGGSGKRT